MTTATLRFSVQAMHKPSNGFDGPTQVDYWRVLDAATGMRADGTAKYATPEQAQRWCDGLNGPVLVGVVPSAEQVATGNVPAYVGGYAIPARP